MGIAQLDLLPMAVWAAGFYRPSHFKTTKQSNPIRFCHWFNIGITLWRKWLNVCSSVGNNTVHKVNGGNEEPVTTSLHSQSLSHQVHSGSGSDLETHTSSKILSPHMFSLKLFYIPTVINSLNSIRNSTKWAGKLRTGHPTALEAVTSHTIPPAPRPV